MSAFNGDKARFHRINKSRTARRERNRILRKKLKSGSAPPPPTGAQL